MNSLLLLILNNDKVRSFNANNYVKYKIVLLYTLNKQQSKLRKTQNEHEKQKAVAKATAFYTPYWEY